MAYGGGGGGAWCNGHEWALSECHTQGPEHAHHVPCIMHVPLCATGKHNTSSTIFVSSTSGMLMCAWLSGARFLDLSVVTCELSASELDQEARTHQSER